MTNCTVCFHRLHYQALSKLQNKFHSSKKTYSFPVTISSFSISLKEKIKLTQFREGQTDSTEELWTEDRKESHRKKIEEYCEKRRGEISWSLDSRNERRILSSDIKEGCGTIGLPFQFKNSEKICSFPELFNEIVFKILSWQSVLEEQILYTQYLFSQNFHAECLP